MLPRPFSLRLALSLLVPLVAITSVQAQFRLNEIFINPPGTDNGLEFIEIQSDAPSASMAGLTLLIIEGDGAGAGIIDQALSLSSFATGSNGLFLWRDSATVLNPAPDPATTLHVADFTPDIENGTNTFLIVNGFTGTLGSDLDTNDDGILDLTPWGAIIDGIGLQENDAGNNFVYGGVPFITSALFNADALARGNDVGNLLFGADFTGTSPGPFTEDLTRTSRTFGDTSTAYALSPGSLNIVATPEPGSFALALLALPAFTLLRRRRA